LGEIHTRVQRELENKERARKGLPSVEEEEDDVKSVAERQSSLGGGGSQMKSQVDEGEKEEEPKPREIESDEVILEFGESTTGLLHSRVNSSFKLLWDGQVSLFEGHHLASMSNRDFVETLQKLRLCSDQDQEPPVTFTHGSQTAKILHTALTRIKFEQNQALQQEKWDLKQAKAAKKAEMLAAGEEYEEEEEEAPEEEEEEDEDGNKKSKDQINTKVMADF
jgi:hypothetical protein